MIKYSIIIPTRNRAKNLKKCLEHITQLNPPLYEYETLIIDNGSTDETKLFTTYFESIIPNIQYIYESTPGLLAARNRGLKEAKGSILCYIDDDSFVDIHWLVGIENAFQDSTVVLAGGANLPYFEAHPPRWLKYFWLDCEFGKHLWELSLLDLGNRKKQISPNFVFGCNFIIKKETLLACKGFHPDCLPEYLALYYGDGETSVAAQLNSQGISALYSPEIKIRHLVEKSRMTEEYFVKRYRNEGYTRSFIQIRKDNNLYDKISYNFIRKSPPKTIIGLIISKRFNILKKVLIKLDQGYKEYMKIKTRCELRCQESYRVHQKKAKKDKDFLNYILKDNYLDGE
ncbi:MAG: hypothetical protein A2X09_15090 [Bacteroidetes bacterium GWF2_43_11]|nr:MAG: hypothetical protein A2X09_15090 [Bacteroidetes bacterium GWF2_43_11]